MAAPPKVSVIIITKNRAPLLRASVESVLRQTFSDFELIVVDDGSTDDTPRLLASLDDPRVRCIRHEVSRGEATARNTGLASAVGEYVAFLDDDDEWLPDKLRLQVALLDSSPANVAAVYTGFSKVHDESGKILAEKGPPHQGDILHDLIQEGNFVLPSTILVRRECFEELGEFDPDLPGAPDWDMWIRIAERYEFRSIEAPLVRYRIHENQISRHLATTVQGVSRLLRKHERYFGVRNRGNGRRYFLLGVWHSLIGELAPARRMYLKAIWYYPFSLKPYTAFGFTLFGAKVFEKLYRLAIGRRGILD